ncbi:MAG: transglutaminase-like cysteine peptidase [Pseudomonadota bacterium]
MSLSILVLVLATATATAESLPAPISRNSESAAQGTASPLPASGISLAETLRAAALTTAARDAAPGYDLGIPVPKPTVSGRNGAAIANGGQAKVLKTTVIFGALGRSVGLSPITRRWQRATAGLADETASSPTVSLSDPAYNAILDAARPLRRGLQIPKVNELVNRLLAYQEDAALYGTGEHWASPAETLSHRAGDCEDFAILKYALLRDLGINDDDMRIVALRDRAIRQFHAVLTVRHKGQWLVLDNRFSRVRFERDLPHYKPLYSVNAAGEWAHTREPGTPVQLAARLKAATR